MIPATRHKLRNGLHSLLLVAGMVLIAMACGYVVAGLGGALWSLIGVGAAAAFSPRVPPAAVLKLYRARPLNRWQFPQGYRVLDELAARAELPSVPRLYYLPSSAVNAFAAGRPRDAAIAITDGMLRSLSPRELAGVLAHEVSHVAHNDLWIMNLADVMSRVTALLSYFGVFLLLLNLPALASGAVMVPWPFVALLMAAPTLMSLLQLALSRSREFDADAGAARLTGDPDALASALVKLERLQRGPWERLFVPGRRQPAPSLLRSHPPTEERVRRLQELRQPPPHLEPMRPPGRPPCLPKGDHVRPQPRPRLRWSGVWY